MKKKWIRKILLLGSALLCCFVAPMKAEARTYYANELPEGIPPWIDPTDVVDDGSTSKINQCVVTNETKYASPFLILYTDDDLTMNSSITLPACTPLKVIGKYTRSQFVEYYVIDLDGAIYFTTYYGTLPENAGYQKYPAEKASLYKDGIKICNQNSDETYNKIASDLQQALNTLDTELTSEMQNHKLNLYLQICNEMQEAMTAAVATGQSSFTYTTPVLSTAKAYSLEFSCIQSDADLAWHAFRGMAEQLGMRVFENYPKTVIQPSTSTLETYAVVLDRDANGNANLGIVNRSINNGSYKKLTNTYQLGELAQITYKFSIQK